jgi:hypothetical protein
VRFRISFCYHKTPSHIRFAVALARLQSSAALLCCLKMPLMTRLRQRDSLSYSVQLWPLLSVADRNEAVIRKNSTAHKYFGRCASLSQCQVLLRRPALVTVTHDHKCRCREINVSPVDPLNIHARCFPLCTRHIGFASHTVHLFCDSKTWAEGSRRCRRSSPDFVSCLSWERTTHFHGVPDADARPGFDHIAMRPSEDESRPRHRLCVKSGHLPEGERGGAQRIEPLGFCRPSSAFQPGYGRLPRRQIAAACCDRRPRVRVWSFAPRRPIHAATRTVRRGKFMSGPVETRSCRRGGN